MKTQTQEFNNVSLALGAALLPTLVAIWGALVLFDGFVLMKIWAWHVVPIGAPAISFSHMVGCRLFFGVFTTPLHPERSKGGDWRKIGMHMLMLALALATAWMFT